MNKNRYLKLMLENILSKVSWRYQFLFSFCNNNIDRCFWRHSRSLDGDIPSDGATHCSCYGVLCIYLFISFFFCIILIKQTVILWMSRWKFARCLYVDVNSWWRRQAHTWVSVSLLNLSTCYYSTPDVRFGKSLSFWADFMIDLEPSSQ